MHHVILLPVTAHGEVAHLGHLAPGRGLDQLGDDLVVTGRHFLSRAGPDVHDVGQLVQELARLRGERFLDFLQQGIESRFERGSGERQQQRAAHVERTHLGHRQPRVGQRLQRQLHHAPHGLAVALVVHQRKAGFLERREVTPNSALVDR